MRLTGKTTIVTGGGTGFVKRFASATLPACCRAWRTRPRYYLSVVALYQKASIEGISLSTRPAVRRLAVAKKAKADAASRRRRSR